MDKTVYRIRRKSDALLSAGGHWPSFSAEGKDWPSLRAINCHLNAAVRSGSYGGIPLEDLEILTVRIMTLEQVCGQEELAAAWKESRVRKARRKLAHEQSMARGKMKAAQRELRFSQEQLRQFDDLHT